MADQLGYMEELKEKALEALGINFLELARSWSTTHPDDLNIETFNHKWELLLGEKPSPSMLTAVNHKLVWLPRPWSALQKPTNIILRDTCKLTQCDIWSLITLFLSHLRLFYRIFVSKRQTITTNLMTNQNVRNRQKWYRFIDYDLTNAFLHYLFAIKFVAR